MPHSPESHNSSEGPQNNKHDFFNPLKAFKADKLDTKDILRLMDFVEEKTLNGLRKEIKRLEDPEQSAFEEALQADPTGYGAVTDPDSALEGLGKNEVEAFIADISNPQHSANYIALEGDGRHAIEMRDNDLNASVISFPDFNGHMLTWEGKPKININDQGQITKVHPEYREL
ncbi:MAG: hypothetical protein JWO47_885 [Candidatus Saccharibacteria bacterium]|nr:hypothetical protein [Candidatus Saccharibacteria bacterium]